MLEESMSSIGDDNSAFWIHNVLTPLTCMLMKAQRRIASEKAWRTTVHMVGCVTARFQIKGFSHPISMLRCYVGGATVHGNMGI
ncbi:hypothetical protein AMEX_G24900 [Astyanax mexicanus]|uniref:Uncharacterized protein n=1 Tax=Astyanax mexicanus TaxID=7994 RepID=A0A8T2KPU9_ASTMX|nr:hypothetical protein AMEX_G24900 [Astyanax mexicanus]